MKFVKLSVLALTMAIFATSCGGAKNDEAAAKASADSAAAAAAATAPAPAPAAPAVDTMHKMDSAAMAPAADAKMEKK